MAIYTPETHPDHHTVGKYYKAHGCIYFCDTYDTQTGYWMDPVFGDVHGFTGKPPHRTNVSERVIGSAFHAVFDVGTPGDPRYTCKHPLSEDERAFVMSVLAEPTPVVHAGPSMR
jgi:hypothetical protein